MCIVTRLRSSHRDTHVHRSGHMDPAESKQEYERNPSRHRLQIRKKSFYAVYSLGSEFTVSGKQVSIRAQLV